MFVDFNKVFKSKPQSQFAVPPAFIEYLNRSLPEGVKYVADEKGTYEDLLDNAPLTYLGVRENLEWSLVEGQELCKIRYLGRNDDNNIFPGDLYELFYYHFPEGWISLGKQQAQREFLIYEQVPAGGLYWLRDLTKGREERIFTWEKGRMNFW